MLPRMEAAGAVAVIVAAGSGARLGKGPKALLSIGDRPLVRRRGRASRRVCVDRKRRGRRPAGATRTRSATRCGGIAKSAAIVTGGATRQRSVAAGMDAVDTGADVVVVHDAARPFASTGAVRGGRRGRTSRCRCRRSGPAARRYGETRSRRLDRRDGASRPARARTDAASVSRPAPSRRARQGGRGRPRLHGRCRSPRVGGRVDPHGCGRTGELQDHDAGGPRPGRFGSSETGVGDVRAGLGFDVHPRDASRALWLGGVRFDGEAGLAGHSDGDAVCHAVARRAARGPRLSATSGSIFPTRTRRSKGSAGSSSWVASSRWSPTQAMHPDRATSRSCANVPRSLRDATRCASPSRESWTFRWSVCRSRPPARRASGFPATASAASRSRRCDDGCSGRRRTAGGRRGHPRWRRAGHLGRPRRPRDAGVAGGHRRGRRSRARHARGGPH